MVIDQVVYFMVVKDTVFQVAAAQDITAAAVVDLEVQVVILLILVAEEVHLMSDIHKLHQVQ